MNFANLVVLCDYSATFSRNFGGDFRECSRLYFQGILEGNFGLDLGWFREVSRGKMEDIRSFH